MDAPAPPIEVRETHISALFFVGDRVYKLKKPVRLDFLDFSDRATRQAVCRRELELNRRLAPDVYLDVVDVVGSDGVPLDHMLVMRRMPAARRLSTLVEQSDVDECLREVARTVATFHARCDRSADIARAAEPDAVLALWDSSFSTMREFTPAVLDPAVLDEVERRARRYVDGRHRLFAQRIDQGLVVDGHGDLLADDVFCLEDGPRILDCIEFDDQLRYGDVLADVAFLAMDLERLGSPRAAQQLLTWYREFSDEHHPTTLAHHYIAARALVRSKVACIRADQGDIEAVAPARALLELARDHLRRATVTLALVGGAPGTGKSTAAEGLADRFGWSLVRSDEVRKDLAGIGHTTRTDAGFGEGIYRADATRATYDTVLDRARTLLEFGVPTVLDASWSDEQWRARARAVAAETSSDIVELRCELPAEVAATRIERRARAGTDASDATPDVAARMATDFDEWPAAITVSTEASPAEVVATTAARVTELLERTE